MAGTTGADGVEIEVVWDGHTRRDWERHLALAGRSALQQGWAYGEALAAGGSRLHRLLARDARGGRPLALAQLVERRLLPCLSVMFLLRGPAWLDPGAREAAEPALLRALGRRFGRSPLVWTPEVPGPRERRPSPCCCTPSAGASAAACSSGRPSWRARAPPSTAEGR